MKKFSVKDKVPDDRKWDLSDPTPEPPKSENKEYDTRVLGKFAPKTDPGPEHPFGRVYEEIMVRVGAICETRNEAQESARLYAEECKQLKDTLNKKISLETKDDARKEIRLAFDKCWSYHFGAETFNGVREAFKKDLGL